MKDFLDRKASIQDNTWSKISSTNSIGEILDFIRSTKFKDITEHLRELLISDSEKYSAEKKRLSAVTFSATFNGSRKSENIDKYNSLIVIDIDKLDNESIISVYEKLFSDEYVFSFWVSPSGKGYKGLVPISFNIDYSKYDLNKLHKHAFSILNRYFLETHKIELDISGSDIPRLCFLSHDSNLVIKGELKEFKIDDAIEITTKNKTEAKISNSKNKSNKILNQPGKNNPFHRKEISSIIKYLEKNKKSITKEYYQWYRVAMAISNTFNYDIGKKVFIRLSMLDKDKFNEENCDRFLKECYISKKNEISINTIRFLATQEGYNSKKLGEESREASL